MTVRFGLPVAAPVRLRVLDLQGRGVAVLADGLWPAGRQSVTWDGTTAAGRAGPGERARRFGCRAAARRP